MRVDGLWAANKIKYSLALQGDLSPPKALEGSLPAASAWPAASWQALPASSSAPRPGTSYNSARRCHRISAPKKERLTEIEGQQA